MGRLWGITVSQLRLSSIVLVASMEHQIFFSHWCRLWYEKDLHRGGGFPGTTYRMILCVRT